MSKDSLNTLKSELRKKEMTFRSSLDITRKAELDRNISENFLSLDEYKNAKIILSYVSSSKEIDTSCIIEKAVLNGKTVAVPRCTDKDGNMDFYIINSYKDLQKGSFGIYEPQKSCEKLKCFTDTICVVPALVFGADGFRIGFGKGYYDRFLCSFGGTKIGLMYDSRIIKNVPRDEYDIKSDIIVTDKKIYHIN